MKSIKYSFLLALIIYFFSVPDSYSQSQITILKNGSLTKTIDNNLDWFKNVSKQLCKSAYVVNFSLPNRSYHFVATNDNCINELPKGFEKDNYQFGQGTSVTDDGKLLSVMYMYNSKIFRVELRRYLSNGELDKSFFENGIISRTSYKKDSEGSMIVFKADENLVIAGYTKSDSTFVYIK